MNSSMHWEHPPPISMQGRQAAEDGAQQLVSVQRGTLTNVYRAPAASGGYAELSYPLASGLSHFIDGAPPCHRPPSSALLTYPSAPPPVSPSCPALLSSPVSPSSSSPQGQDTCGGS